MISYVVLLLSCTHSSSCHLQNAIHSSFVRNSISRHQRQYTHIPSSVRVATGIGVPRLFLMLGEGQLSTWVGPRSSLSMVVPFFCGEDLHQEVCLLDQLLVLTAEMIEHLPDVVEGPLGI